MPTRVLIVRSTVDIGMRRLIDHIDDEGAGDAVAAGRATRRPRRSSSGGARKGPSRGAATGVALSVTGPLAVASAESSRSVAARGLAPLANTGIEMRDRGASMQSVLDVHDRRPGDDARAADGVADLRAYRADSGKTESSETDLIRAERHDAGEGMRCGFSRSPSRDGMPVPVTGSPTNGVLALLPRTLMTEASTFETSVSIRCVRVPVAMIVSDVRIGDGVL